jgi:Spy/CpxP family protein refolding chaperone
MTRFNFKTLTLALATAGALNLAGPLLAKPGHDPVQRLSAKLELSTEQQHQLSALFEAHREQMRADGSRERGERREARMALNAEIRELLNAEQAEQFDAMQRRGGKGYGGQRRGGHFQALELSDEQRQQMRALMHENRGREDVDRAELREQMRAILSEEQLAQLDAARAERGRKYHGQRGGRGQRD